MIRDEDFDQYICYLAHNIWRFPFWVEERQRERQAADGGDSQNRYDNAD